MMKYLKQYKNENKAFEITKDAARKSLCCYWNEAWIKDIFENEKEFRLYTPFAEVWTVTDDGKTPPTRFYGVVGEE